MIFLILILSCIIFGYVIGYAHTYFKYDAETKMILKQVEFWKGIVARQRLEIKPRKDFIGTLDGQPLYVSPPIYPQPASKT